MFDVPVVVCGYWVDLRGARKGIGAAVLDQFKFQGNGDISQVCETQDMIPWCSPMLLRPGTAALLGGGGRQFAGDFGAGWEYKAGMAFTAFPEQGRVVELLQ